MSDEYLVETILPKNEIHLLAGPSGAGKTRWLLHTLKQWEKGKPFLGYSSFPVPWTYVATDRSLKSVHRTMKCLDIDPASINIVPAFGRDRKTLMQIFDAAISAGSKLLVIEAFGKFADGNNASSVEAHLSAVQACCEMNDVTVIGVVESPKMKPTERYENPRQRVSGCASWAHFTETIFLVEPEDVSDPSKSARCLTVCPRNQKGMVLKGAFDGRGRLIF